MPCGRSTFLQVTASSPSRATPIGSSSMPARRAGGRDRSPRGTQPEDPIAAATKSRCRADGRSGGRPRRAWRRRSSPIHLARETGFLASGEPGVATAGAETGVPATAETAPASPAGRADRRRDVCGRRTTAGTSSNCRCCRRKQQHSRSGGAGGGSWLLGGLAAGAGGGGGSGGNGGRRPFPTRIRAPERTAALAASSNCGVTVIR